MKEIEIAWIKNKEPIKLGDYAKDFGIDINTLSYYSEPFSTFPWGASGTFSTFKLGGTIVSTASLRLTLVDWSRLKNPVQFTGDLRP